MKKTFDINEYWERNKLIGKYGILYLDKELLGIAKTDFVMIGTQTRSLKDSILKTFFHANDPQKVAIISLPRYWRDMDELPKTLKQCVDNGFDLIVLDDFEWLDCDTQEGQDVRDGLIKAIHIAQDAGATIVVFSVLELPTREGYDIIPDESAFVGLYRAIMSATQVITFAPANDNNTGIWCRICKNRNGGITGNVAKLTYMPSTESFKPGYDLCAANYSGARISFLEHVD